MPNSVDGSVHGSVEERSPDPYHTQRVVQHAFFDPSTHRDLGKPDISSGVLSS